MSEYDFDLKLHGLDRLEFPPDDRLFTRTSQPLRMHLCWGVDFGDSIEVTAQNISYEGALFEPAPGHVLPMVELSNVQLRIGDDTVAGQVDSREWNRIRVRFESIGPGLAERIYRHLTAAPDTELVERQF